MTVQTMNGNVAPPFWYCWTRFWSTSWSSNYAYDILFQILGSQESSASNGMQFGGEMKKLWSFEDKRAKLSENFVAETPFGRVFRSCETTFWHTSAILQHSSPHFWSCDTPAKSLLSFEMAMKWSLSFEMAVKWSPNFEMSAKSPPSLEMAFKLRNWLAKWREGLQKHLAKPREVAKMPIEPCNHASEEESPVHPRITDTMPLTPFLTS